MVLLEKHDMLAIFNVIEFKRQMNIHFITIPRLYFIKTFSSLNYPADNDIWFYFKF